jgi:broad specificity phosphatase PhoE
VEQSRLLGEHWAERGVRAARALVGPRRRHRQTHDAVAAAYAARGVAWPEAEDVPELDEHHGPRVVEAVLRAAAADAPDGADGPTLAAGAGVLDRDERLRRYLVEYARVTRLWARGEVGAPGVEPFGDFRARVERGLRRIAAEAAGADGVTVLFTSGGPVGVAVGLALGLGDEQTLELSWAVSNASVSEFAHDGGRLALAVFNACRSCAPSR